MSRINFHSVNTPSLHVKAKDKDCSRKTLDSSMPLNHISSIPFTLHALVELPAAYMFAFSPSATLSNPRTSDANAVIRQYALLLLSSTVIAATFAFEDWVGHEGGSVEQRVAGALALYHFGPLIRALSRSRREEARGSSLPGNPLVHALLHLNCGIALAGRFWDCW